MCGSMLYAPPPNSFQSGVLPHEAAVVIQLSVQVYALGPFPQASNCQPAVSHCRFAIDSQLSVQVYALGPSRKQAIVSQRYHIAGLL